MTTQRLAVALAAINVALVLLLVAQARSTTPEPVAPTLRGRALELVDDRGRVRSRLDVEPGGAVVLRLLDQHGTIRVKLGADEDGSGLVLLDGTTEPGIHALAKRAGSSITLRGPDGQERVLRP